VSVADPVAPRRLWPARPAIRDRKDGRRDASADAAPVACERQVAAAA
jgi:hypothetical protein